MSPALRGMKFLVIMMGIVLMGSVMMIVYIGMKKVNGETDAQSLQPSSQHTSNKPSCNEEIAPITLPKGRIQYPIMRSGDDITLTVRGIKNIYIVTANSCNGTSRTLEFTQP